MPSLIHRRQFMGSAAFGLTGLMLPGCASGGARPAVTRPAQACLAPVDVSENRVIRTLAGIRPYRASGFVVRGETLGDRKLVHNYGHGGAGITLSWGTSRLAVDLGLPGHQGPVAVIGAGAIGLTTARLVQEAGFPVTLYAEALPPHTTSDVAGGQWSPFGHFRDERVTAEWRTQLASALDYSWRRFQIMVGEDYGIRWLPTYSQDSGGDDPEEVVPFHPGIRRLRAHEHPFPVDHVFRFDTLYVETGRFLRELLRDLQTGGGRIVRRRFASPTELAQLPERLIFNCTGFGAAALFGDGEMEPVRGQLAVLLPQPEIGYAFSGRAGYMFPRPDGILLGGTFERGIAEARTDPAAIRRIVQSHQRLFAGFRCAPGSA